MYNIRYYANTGGFIKRAIMETFTSLSVVQKFPFRAVVVGVNMQNNMVELTDSIPTRQANRCLKDIYTTFNSSHVFRGTNKDNVTVLRNGRVKFLF
jgi:hypothetical protein